jgi:amidophosphoribosyltransferase
MLREAGAREVHVRISSPPVQWPCFYGIDFASRAELIANGLTVEQVCASIGADTLGYIAIDELVSATTLPGERLCTACFTGEYPIPLPAPELLGKHMLEGISRAVESDQARHEAAPDPVFEPVLPGIGASDALQRP